jgi:hypothetical protein
MRTAGRARAEAAALLLGVAATLGPGSARAVPDATARAAAGSVAPGIRGVLAIEPGRIRAGEVATLEVVVTTPPGHRLRPIVPPAELPGFWILDAEALQVEKEDGRWIHRTRLRLRARELGQYVWPAQPVEIETPDGATQRLVLDGRPLEVVSVQAEFPGRSVPFGLREPDPDPAAGGSTARAAAAGALAGAAAVALLGVARRARRRRHGIVSVGGGGGGGPGAATPWRAAREELETLPARIEGDPDGAGDALARILRAHASWRWRRDLHASTTPELSVAPPPPEASEHWPVFLALLGALDEMRFLPDPTRDARETLRGVLTRVRAFVTDTTPPGAKA